MSPTEDSISTPMTSRMRPAVAEDLPVIIALLADDVLGQTREDSSHPPNPAYLAAFAAIQADPHQMLAVMEDPAGRVIGCLQLSFIPGLSRLGGWRGQIESVRIASDRRGGGMGRAMIEWAVAQCRERGCRLVQLTTDRSRADTVRFYEGLGFTASHIGMKMSLEE